MDELPKGLKSMPPPATLADAVEMREFLLGARAQSMPKSLMLRQLQLEELSLFGWTLAPTHPETPMTNEDTKAPDRWIMHELEDRRLLVSLLELRHLGLTSHCQALVQAESCLEAAEALMAKAAPAIRDLEKQVARKVEEKPSTEARVIELTERLLELIRYNRSAKVLALYLQTTLQTLELIEAQQTAPGGALVLPLKLLQQTEAALGRTLISAPKKGLCLQVDQQRWELITARPIQDGRSTMIVLLQEEIHGRLLSRSDLDVSGYWDGMVTVPLDELMRQGIITSLEISTK